ncbi:MAG: hypothetical protein IPI58_07145 [Alphaproteobacteria bacterium]|nr:MAG: hypothetical protein IPI58_07145 [Alphaproteobacteria bacterium]
MNDMAPPPASRSRLAQAGISRLLPVPNWLLIVPGVLLLPLAFFVFLALPQGEDFCFYVAAHVRALPQVLALQYDHVGARFASMTLALIPDLLGRAIKVPVSYLYILMLLACLSALAGAAWVLADRLMPRIALRTRVFLTLMLLAVLAGHAPSVRGLLFWLPGVVSFTLPGLALALFMATLYRSLADHRWIEPPTAWGLAALLAVAGLCNESAGFMIAALAGISFFVRRYLRLDDQPLMHLGFVALGLACALVIGLAPGTWDRSEATRAVSSLLWGGADHEGIGWRAAARWLGVLGWLGMLMVLVVQFPPPQRQPDPRHIGGLAGFGLAVTLVSMIVTWIAAHWGLGHWNQHHVLSIVALSLPAVLLARYYGHLLMEQLAVWRVPAPAVLIVSLVLVLASPGILGAIVQMPDAWTFQRESRARFQELAKDPGSIAYLPMLSVQPGLLFDSDLSTSGRVAPNDCMATLFGKRAVIGQEP